jgi:hypothetical protein
MEDDIMHTARWISRWFLVLLTVISVILPASAREKTDEIILKNGNNITCWIQNLSRGMLTVKTDSASTLQIKWQDVTKITSKFQFTVQDIFDQIYVGSLQPSAEERRVDVLGSQPANSLHLDSIVRIQEVEGSQWKRYSGSLDLSYAFTKASDRTQFDFSGDVKYQAVRNTVQLNYSTTFGTSKGETDADRKLLSLAGIWELKGRWLAYTEMRYEHNLELQLDRRFSVFAGPGYRITHSNRSQVTAVAAATFSRESYYGEDLKKNLEGLVGIDAQFFKLYSPKFDIVNQFFYLPNFSTGGRRRLEFNSKVRIEVLRDFFVALTFYDSYDSKPPSETAAKNDYGFTTGLSWSFRR